MGLIDAIIAVPGLRRLDDRDEWCAGLPLERIRILDSSENEILKLEISAQYRRQRSYAISFASLFAILYLTSILLPSPLLFWLTACGASVMTLFVFWLVSDPTSWLRKNRAMNADLLHGVVHSFHHPACAGPLEVLPRSEVVYKPNEFSPRKWKQARITSTAKTPPIATIASDWLQPVQDATGRFFSGRRELSTGEIEEINQAVGKICEMPKRNYLLFFLWILFSAWLCRSGSHELFYIALAISAASVLRVAPEIVRAIALQGDVRGGFVVINRRASIKDSTLVPIGNVAEYLPLAKMKWTDDGAPADWRKNI